MVRPDGPLVEELPPERLGLDVLPLLPQERLALVGPFGAAPLPGLGQLGVGLRRRGLPADTVADIKRAFRIAYADGASCADAARAALDSGEVATPEGRRFLEFFLGGRRGRFAQPSR